jgi:hypothetical protein
MTKAHSLVRDLQEANSDLFRAADDARRLSAMATEAWDVSVRMADACDLAAWSHACKAKTDVRGTTVSAAEAKIDWGLLGESTVAWEQLTLSAMKADAEPSQVWFGSKPEAFTRWIVSKTEMAHLRREIIDTRDGIFASAEVGISDFQLWRARATSSIPQDCVYAKKSLAPPGAWMEFHNYMPMCAAPPARIDMSFDGSADGGWAAEDLAALATQILFHRLRLLRHALTGLLEIVQFVMRIGFAAPLPPEFDRCGTFLKERTFFELHGMGRPPSLGWAC